MIIYHDHVDTLKLYTCDPSTQNQGVAHYPENKIMQYNEKEQNGLIVKTSY